MVTIDWTEFKEFRASSMKKDDNFATIIDFLKSYYNMFSAQEIFDTLKYDETSNMMLEKRNITNAEGIEDYLFKVV